MKNITIIFIVFLFVINFSVNAKGGDAMKLTSPSFENNQMIPREFTCQGSDISPELSIEGVPEGTKSLALIVDDPDAPMGNWDHWIVFDIPPETTVIEKGSVPGKQGINDFRRLDYGGPCPPSGTHRYFFKLFALDTVLDVDEGIRKKQLEQAMEGHIIEKTELIGLYKQQR